MNDLMTPSEAAAVLRLPEATLRQWRYLGRGPAYMKVGKHIRYRQADLTKWIDTQRIEPTNG